MTIRLNRDISEQIIDSVLASTTLGAEKEAILAETERRAYELLIAQVDPQLVALAKNHPASWFHWLENSLYIGRQAAVWSPEFILTGNNRGYISFSQSIPVPNTSGLLKLTEEQFTDLTRRAEAWAEKRSQIRGELATFLVSCRTIEKVLERMPELAPHIPKVTKTYPLVAPSNLVSTLMSAGWPKGGAPAAV